MEIKTKELEIIKERTKCCEGSCFKIKYRDESGTIEEKHIGFDKMNVGIDDVERTYNEGTGRKVKMLQITSCKTFHHPEMKCYYASCTCKNSRLEDMIYPQKHYHIPSNYQTEDIGKLIKDLKEFRTRELEKNLRVTDVKFKIYLCCEEKRTWFDRILDFIL